MLRSVLTWLAMLLCSLLLAQEVCDNGVDDDGDGLIDLNDPDCICSTSLMTDSLASYIRNHSFEEQGCCPYGFVGAFNSTPPWLSCATGWHQATLATSDYFHSCGYAPVGMPLPPPDGQGAVGFFAYPGYHEYVGTCLTYPAPSNPLLAGVTYTLSLWISTAAVNNAHTQPISQADPSYFTDRLPLAIFGRANGCVPFPIEVTDCIGQYPGWVELGRVMVQPAWEWTRVSITFTPAADIHTILIGGACDVPASFNGMVITNPQGETYSATPYFLVDDLMLTEAGDQVLLPVSTTGTICMNSAMVTGVPPAGLTNLQWYRDGVALVGHNGPTLNVAQLGMGGVYTLAGQYNGQCLMGASYVPPAIEPVPWPFLTPTLGCVPHTVTFVDTTGGGITVGWDLGDGTTSTADSLVHIYTVPGSYDVRLTVRNQAGCTADSLMVGAVVVDAMPAAELSASPNPTDIEHTQVELSSAGSTGAILDWWWDLGAVPPHTSPSADLTVDFPAVAGEYPVMLVVTTGAGCTDTVRSVVVITEPGVVNMPNVFSPNGDGHNDRFVPIKYNGTPALLEIYNRWGQQVFSTRSLAQGWSGKDVPDGTYYFLVTPDDPEVSAVSGHVTLVR